MRRGASDRCESGSTRTSAATSTMPSPSRMHCAIPSWSWSTFRPSSGTSRCARRSRRHCSQSRARPASPSSRDSVLRSRRSESAACSATKASACSPTRIPFSRPDPNRLEPVDLDRLAAGDSLARTLAELAEEWLAGPGRRARRQRCASERIARRLARGRESLGDEPILADRAARRVREDERARRECAARSVRRMRPEETGELAR